MTECLFIVEYLLTNLRGLAKLRKMFQNISETLTLIASTAVQRLFYLKRWFPKHFAPKRILVVKLDHLGDVLLATPVFSNLSQAYPDAELHALTGAWSRVVLEKHPDINKVLEYNSPAFCRTGSPTSLKQTFQLYRALRREKYDLMVELRNDWRIVCFSLLRVAPKRLDRATLQVANKLGFARFTGIHETTRNLDVLDKAGIPTPIKTTIFSVTAEDKKWASNFLTAHQIGEERPLIAIHPGSPVPLKRWMPERYAELADWLIARKRAKILFVGVADEMPIITETQRLMQAESINIAGKTTLTQLASILRISNVFIGNDSGPMHLAAAVGTPTIGLYGPGDPTRFGPVGAKCRTIQSQTDCPPCTGTTCRFGKDGCMSKIQVADVIQTLEEAEYLSSENSKI
ncbi:lipopolysaccharide heptosyltransferase II [Candidatus Poribacteria bacterium]|nr:lipopolysaccharide heptosyltransferase II [Candidatus Poribacteria bacterium]MYK21403.1 lipopolysaccharide heptosyltransferase II [Candidatus Poribacteria bacterium]